MKNLYLLKQELSPDQAKVFEEIILQWEDTQLAYKHVQKRYSGIKRNIKAIEKRLIVLMDSVPEKDHTPRWIEWEIASIENKYKVIDKAIKNYKEVMQVFNKIVSMPNFRTFNPNHQNDWFIYNLKNPLSLANHHINQALDAMRITKRYFHNISNTFKSHAERVKLMKRYAAMPPPPAPVEQEVPDASYLPS